MYPAIFLRANCAILICNLTNLTVHVKTHTFSEHSNRIYYTCGMYNQYIQYGQMSRCLGKTSQHYMFVSVPYSLDLAPKC